MAIKRKATKKGSGKKPKTFDRVKTSALKEKNTAGSGSAHVQGHVLQTDSGYFREPTEKNILEEPAIKVAKHKLVMYSGENYVNAANVVLGDATDKPESQMTPLEKMSIVRVGVTKNALEQLKLKTDLDYDELAKILSVARATLINKKGEEKFNNTLSEKIVGLADIYSYGYDVFENEDNFNQWMFRSNKALNGQTPFDLIDNQFGREEVKDLIGRIDYGVYS